MGGIMCIGCAMDWDASYASWSFTWLPGFVCVCVRYVFALLGVMEVGGCVAFVLAARGRTHCGTSGTLHQHRHFGNFQKRLTFGTFQNILVILSRLQT